MAFQQHESTVNAKDIWIDSGVFNQPIVHSTFISSRDVYIAHTDNVGCALLFESGHPMGIDIEPNKNQNSATIKKLLTAFEIDLLEQKWSSKTVMAPYTWIWTVKEALSKVLKTGLTVPLDIYEVDNISIQDRYIVGTYRKFSQYKSVSFLFQETTLISIVFPKKTELFFGENESLFNVL